MSYRVRDASIIRSIKTIVSDYQTGLLNAREYDRNKNYILEQSSLLINNLRKHAHYCKEIMNPVEKTY